MTWYAAHLVYYLKLKQKRQRRYLLWENIVLLSARTEDEALKKADARAMDDPCMERDESLTWGGEPAEWVYAGVRTLTECVDSHKRPNAGTEVTYLEYEVDSQAAVRKLVEGKTVSVKLIERFPVEDLPVKDSAHEAAAS